MSNREYIFIANYAEHDFIHKKTVIRNTNKRALLSELNCLMLKDGFEMDELYGLKEIHIEHGVYDDYGKLCYSENEYQKFLNGIHTLPKDR